MARRRAVLAGLGTLSSVVLGGCAAFSGGGDAGVATTVDGPGGFSVTSSAIADGGPIPTKYTADGADVSPPLTVEGVPAGADSLAVVADDPDADGFVHWLLWDVPADRTDIPEAVPQSRRVESLGGARQGTNGFGELGYRGPRPPPEDGPHTYNFTVYAVAGAVNAQAGVSRGTLGRQLDGKVVASARLSGEYDR